MNCTLSKNVSPRVCRYSPGEIEQRIYIYNVDDVTGLEFEEDRRWDASNRIQFIHSGGLSPFTIESNGATFEGTYDTGTLMYTYTLTIPVADVSREIADALYESHSSRYFVAFRPVGDQDYIVVGFKNGCSLSDSYNIGEGNQSATITLSVASQYPMLFSDPRNFDEKLARQIIFKPDYTDYFCEDGEGRRTGYKIAKHVLGWDSAGNALDRDGVKVSVSGRLQVAYKLEGEDDGEYDIIGEYGITSEFNGLPVSTYDVLACDPSLQGSISVNPSEIWLNNSHTSELVTINSTHSWSIANISEVGQGLGLYDTLGGDGDKVRVWANEGGLRTVVFKNNITTSERDLTVHVNLMSFSEPSLDPGQRFIPIPFFHSTENEDITFTTTTGTVTGFDDEYAYLRLDGQDTGEVTVTANCDADPGFTASITITVPAHGEEDPIWDTVSLDCPETKPGYAIETCVDNNPGSPTYGTETVFEYRSLECEPSEEAEWTEIGSRCEGDDRITTYIDTNPNSPTFNMVRVETVEGGCAVPKFEYYAKIAGFYPQRKEIRIRYERGEEWKEIGEGLYVGWFSNGEAVMNPIASDGTWTSVDCRAVGEAGVYTKITSPTEMTQSEADAYARGEAQKAKLYLATSAMYTEPDFYMVNDITVNPEMETFQYPGGKIKTYLDKTIELPSDPWSPPTSVIVAARTDRWASSTYFNVGFRGEPFDGNAVNFATNDKAGGFGFARVPVRRNDPNLVTQWIQDFMADKAYVRLYRNGITQVGISEAGKAVFGYLATDKSTDPQDNDIFVNGQGKGLTLNSNGYLRCEVTEPITSLRDAFKAFSDGKNCSVTEICIPLNLDCENLTDIAYAFSAVDGADENLTTIYDLAHIDISHCTSLLRMFENRKKLETLAMNYWPTSHITSWHGTFHNCEGLKNLKIGTIGALDHSTLTNDMFKGCVNLTDLHVDEIRQGLSLADCAKLNLASIRRVLYALNEPRTASTLTVSQATWDIIQGDPTCLGYIEAARGLGWTVAM